MDYLVCSMARCVNRDLSYNVIQRIKQYILNNPLQR